MGKVFLSHRGVFDDVAMAMMVHSAPEETRACISLATQACPVPAAVYRVAITGPGRSALSRVEPPDWQHRCGQPDPGAAGDPSDIAIDCGDAVNHYPDFATAWVSQRYVVPLPATGDAA